MKKNWRLTAVFAGLFAVLAAVYFLANPPATTPLEKMDPRVVPLTADQVTKIEVDRKGTVLTFERATDVLGEHWRVVGKNSHAADATLVQQMLFGLDRFLKAGGLDPGKPETAPELTGLNDPRITVTFTAAGQREVLKFGKQPPTNTTATFYQRQGDPKVYLVSVDTVEAFNKPVFQYRAKTLARYAPHRIGKVILEFKFLRPQGKDKPDLVEYEKSVLERFEEGLERGWYLTQPHREKLDDHKVAALVTELSTLQAGEYQPEGDPKQQGFDEPQVKVALFSSGDDKPVAIQFGAPAEKGKKRWVRVTGTGEVALYDSFRYDGLPVQRNHFRNSVIFPFSAELVKRFELEAKDLGKVVLERREVKKEGESVGTEKWEVIEPKDLRVESERLEAFVAAVVIQNVTGFMGAQDFKMAGLDPAPILLTITTKEGRRHVCGFNASVAQGYLRKEGVNEIFEVRPDFVRMLQRLELNFVNMEMFNVLRDQLREFSFEGRFSGELPVYYALQRDDKGKWAFSDPANKGAEPEADRVNGLLAMLNYIKAEGLIGRDDKLIQKHRLEERIAPGTLKIVHEGGTAELYVSENLSDKPGQPLYYARFKDNKTVFQIGRTFVVSLKEIPRKKPEEK